MDDGLKQLDKQQIESLIGFIAEDCGTDLSKGDFGDALLLVIENVAFDSSFTEEEEAQLITRCFADYKQFGVCNG